MPQGYSRDLRERLLRAVTSGVPVAEIARTTDVSMRSVFRWKSGEQAGDALEPGQSSGRPRMIGDEDDAALRAQVAERPDATLAEHCAAWEASGHRPVSTSTMSRALARLQMTVKKRP